MSLWDYIQSGNRWAAGPEYSGSMARMQTAKDRVKRMTSRGTRVPYQTPQEGINMSPGQAIDWLGNRITSGLREQASGLVGGLEAAKFGLPMTPEEEAQYLNLIPGAGLTVKAEKGLAQAMKDMPLTFGKQAGVSPAMEAEIAKKAKTLTEQGNIPAMLKPQAGGPLSMESVRQSDPLQALALDYRMTKHDEGSFKDAMANFGFDPDQAAKAWGDSEETLNRMYEEAMGSKGYKQAIEKYPEIRQLPLSPSEMMDMTPAQADTMMQFYSGLSKDELAAGALAGISKKGWYKDSAKMFYDVFGMEDAPRVAGIMAALSPQTSVESNFRNAVRFFREWDKAGRPIDEGTIRSILAHNVEGSEYTAKSNDQLKKMIERANKELGKNIRMPGSRTGKLNALEANLSEDELKRMSVLPAWENNVVRAAQAADPYAMTLSGAKVNSFYNNLMGSVNEVTNDAWMQLGIGKPAKMFGENVFGKGSRVFEGQKNFGVKSGEYTAMNAATREVADQLTKQTGERWTPEQVQETFWSYVKTATEKRAGKGGYTKIKDMPVSHEEVSAAPDFAKLFIESDELMDLYKGTQYEQRIRTAVESARNSIRGRAQGLIEGKSTGHRGLLGKIESSVARRVTGPLNDAVAAGPRPDGSIQGYVGPRSGRMVEPGLNTVVEKMPVLPAARNKFVKAGGSAPDMNHLVGTDRGQVFHDAIQRAIDANPSGASVYKYTPEEYANMKTFLSDDGMTGFAVKGDDIVSVFNNPQGPNKGAVQHMINMAVANGGRRLDAFDTVLPELYGKAGFREVARIKWSDAAAPEGWDKEAYKRFNNGEPDVVFMVYDPKNAGTHRALKSDYIADYDMGEKIQQKALKGKQIARKPTKEEITAAAKKKKAAEERAKAKRKAAREAKKKAPK